LTHFSVTTPIGEFVRCLATRSCDSSSPYTMQSQNAFPRVLPESFKSSGVLSAKEFARDWTLFPNGVLKWTPPTRDRDADLPTIHSKMNSGATRWGYIVRVRDGVHSRGRRCGTLRRCAKPEGVDQSDKTIQLKGKKRKRQQTTRNMGKKRPGSFSNTLANLYRLQERVYSRRRCGTV